MLGADDRDGGERHQDIEDDGDGKCDDQGEGDGSLRVPRLLGEFYHLLKPHVGEEDECGRLQEPRDSLRHIEVIHLPEIREADQDDHDDASNLDEGQGDGDPGGLLDAVEKYPGEDEYDQNC